MENRQNDNKSTFQVRLDRGWRKILTTLRADTGSPIRRLVEDALSELYSIDDKGRPYRLR